jgi:hypothetical protein
MEKAADHPAGVTGASGNDVIRRADKRQGQKLSKYEAFYLILPSRIYHRYLASFPVPACAPPHQTGFVSVQAAAA